jgi:hypothetical protein
MQLVFLSEAKHAFIFKTQGSDGWKRIILFKDFGPAQNRL